MTGNNGLVAEVIGNMRLRYKERRVHKFAVKVTFSVHVVVGVLHPQRVHGVEKQNVGGIFAVCEELADTAFNFDK